jgi:hypothetical protein
MRYFVKLASLANKQESKISRPQCLFCLSCSAGSVHHFLFCLSWYVLSVPLYLPYSVGLALPVLFWPSCTGYPVLIVLSRLSCLGTVVQFWQSCHSDPALADLFWLFCPDYTVLLFLFCLSRFGCHVRTVLWLSDPGGSVIAVLSLFSCPSCSVLSVRSGKETEEKWISLQIFLANHSKILRKCFF